MALSFAIFRSVEASEIRCSRALEPDINSVTNFRRAIEYHRRSSSPSTAGKNSIPIFSNSFDRWNDDRTTGVADGGICVFLRGGIGDFLLIPRVERIMGMVSAQVMMPVCESLCFFCPALRARSRHPIKRYKKLLADIFPRSQVLSLSPSVKNILDFCQLQYFLV